MTSSSSQSRIDSALVVTAAASAVVMRYFRNIETFESKADESPVTQADREAESVMREMIEQRFPGESIFGEEFGALGQGDSTWVVDPIDGTRSFIAGLPLFGMLLGYQSPEGDTVGVIRMPALNEVYSGVSSQGATRNGEAIATSHCTDLNHARLFINEGDKLALQVPEVFGRLVRSAGFRRMGADCYSHALVAAGTMDAVIDFDLQPYDYLPVAAVVQAAGGVMTDWQGNDLTFQSDGRTLTAATPELHEQLLNLVSGEG